MFGQFPSDIIENEIIQMDRRLLSILLFDRSTRKNIIWATDDYATLGEAYQRKCEILPELITGEHTLVIQPRTAKSVENQQSRVRDKAEVFTPSWVCNEQNNLVDEAWFGTKNVFNTLDDKAWTTNKEMIPFQQKGHHTWKRYVDAKRMEISCGEAPYPVSRYDAATGKIVPLPDRIGLLDRKFRVINENSQNKEEWIVWAVRAIQSVYGFEFQGDSLLLARENVFITFLEYYFERYQELPDITIQVKIAKIVSWNLWQMDGLRFVAPYSCKSTTWEEMSLFGNIMHEEQCPGCKNDDNTKHTGIYCKVMDWRDKQSFRYIDLVKGAKRDGCL